MPPLDLDALRQKIDKQRSRVRQALANMAITGDSDHLWQQDERALTQAIMALDELAEARRTLQAIMQTLGPTVPNACECEGCQHEMQQTLDLLTAAGITYQQRKPTPPTPPDAGDLTPMALVAELAEARRTLQRVKEWSERRSKHAPEGDYETGYVDGYACARGWILVLFGMPALPAPPED